MSSITRSGAKPRRALDRLDAVGRPSALRCPSAPAPRQARRRRRRCRRRPGCGARGERRRARRPRRAGLRHRREHRRQAHFHARALARAVAVDRHVPPCSSTSRLTIDRPMPSPPCERSIVAIELGEHVEHLRQHLRRDAAAVVAARRCTRFLALALERRSRMWPPRSVYLQALLSRLVSTCTSRVGSASTWTGIGGSDTASWWPLASISGRQASTAALHHGASSIGCRRSSSLLRVMRLTSIRSSTRRTRCDICRSITPTTPTASGRCRRRRA